MKAEILSIGDELLIGQVVNTNASYIGQKLTALGFDVKWITTVGDDQEELRKVLDAAFQRADVIIATGGLGPTHDDVTTKAVAEFFGARLVLKPEILDRIGRVFERRGLEMPKVNEAQAYVPDNAQLIDNRVGTAPGLMFERQGKYLFVLPGVPQEMKAMMEETVLPFLKSKGAGQAILMTTLRTVGLPESMLYEKIGDIAALEQLVSVAFLPTRGGVDVRLTARGADEEECRQRLEEAENRIRKRAGEYIYATGDEGLEQVVAHLLFEKKLTLAVAESCTGGLLAHRLTNIPGSSEYFERGIIAYSNRAKRELLGVPAEVIDTHGAVSAESAVAMAEGVRRVAETHIGISITGIAGPTGGTPEKPVGLVYIGYADAATRFAQKHIFTTERLLNKERSAQAALEILRRRLLQW